MRVRQTPDFRPVRVSRNLAMVCGMPRVRISTTVDASRLADAQHLLDLPPSRLLDRALAALCREVESEREAAALAAHPYEEDPDLAWDAPPGPILPYEGEVPPEVLRLARESRRRR